MVIDRAHRRLLKSALLRVWRKLGRQSEDWPVYYMTAPTTKNARDATIESVKCMQSLSAVPWPGESCIVCAEPICPIIPGRDPDRLITPENFQWSMVDFPDDFDIRAPNTPSLYTYIIHSREKARCLLLDVLPAAHRSQLEEKLDHSMANWCCVTFNMSELRGRLRPPLKGGLWEVDMLVLFERASKHSKVDSGQTVEESVDSGLRGFLPDTEDVWTAGPFSGFHLPIDGIQKYQTWFSVACIHFMSLCSLAFPCGYQVKMRLGESFGTKRQRKWTPGKRILAHVSHDRLYRSYLGATETKLSQAPHFRRGHIRHLWKQAGIDRFALPLDPFARVRMAAERRVRRIYVHPAWVGDNRFSDGLSDCEIVVGETELAPLGKSNGT